MHPLLATKAPDQTSARPGKTAEIRRSPKQSLGGGQLSEHPWQLRIGGDLDAYSSGKRCMTRQSQMKHWQFLTSPATLG